MPSSDADRSWLPPGQSPTRKFPIVGEKAPPLAALDLDTWRLEITGRVEPARTLSYGEFRGLEQHSLTFDVHCVTGWSRAETTFRGVPLAALLSEESSSESIASRPMDDARFVRFVAYSDRDHDTSLPLDAALESAWLVHSRDGEPLEPEHGWPLRVVMPGRYFYKSLKWVRRIELLAEDRLGFWERTSDYHNVGDPWPGDQRFVTGSLDRKALERFLAAETFGRWRGKVLLGLPLRGWEPADRDLRGLLLKSCDLREAALAGVDLREANLSLSDLRGADLRSADLRGADLEGADFRGADLRGADLRDTALSATRFVSPSSDDASLARASSDAARVDAARVEGMRFEGSQGLLEEQESYLRRAAGG